MSPGPKSKRVESALSFIETWSDWILEQQMKERYRRGMLQVRIILYIDQHIRSFDDLYDHLSDYVGANELQELLNELVGHQMLEMPMDGEYALPTDKK